MLFFALLVILFIILGNYLIGISSGTVGKVIGVLMIYLALAVIFIAGFVFGVSDAGVKSLFVILVISAVISALIVRYIKIKNGKSIKQ